MDHFVAMSQLILNINTNYEDDLTYYEHDRGQDLDEFDLLCSPAPSCTVSRRNTGSLLPFIDFCEISIGPENTPE